MSTSRSDRGRLRIDRVDQRSHGGCAADAAPAVRIEVPAHRRHGDDAVPSRRFERVLERVGISECRERDERGRGTGDREAIAPAHLKCSSIVGPVHNHFVVPPLHRVRNDDLWFVCDNLHRPQVGCGRSEHHGVRPTPRQRGGELEFLGLGCASRSIDARKDTHPRSSLDAAADLRGSEAGECGLLSSEDAVLAFRRACEA